MSMDVRKVKLDFNKTFQSDIPSVQGDTGRSIEFQIMNGSLAEDITGETVKIFGLKPDGFRVFNNATITDAANGKCTVDLTTQMLCVAGTLQCTLVRYKNNERLSSRKFNIEVSGSVADDIEIESTNEYLALTDALSVTKDNLSNAVETKINQMLADGDLANMTIKPKSISGDKLGDNAGDGLIFTKSVNLFNKDNIITGKYLNGTNQEVVSNGACYGTEYISVNYGSIYSFTGFYGNTSQMVLYDGAKQPLGVLYSSFCKGSYGDYKIKMGYKWENDQWKLKTEFNEVAYVRINTTENASTSYMLVEGEELPSTYKPHSVDYKIKSQLLTDCVKGQAELQILADIEAGKIKTKIEDGEITDTKLSENAGDGLVIENSSNLFNKNVVSEGYLKENGDIVTGSSCHSDFIPVEHGAIYSFTGHYNNVYQFLTYDVNKNFIEVIYTAYLNGSYGDYKAKIGYKYVDGNWVDRKKATVKYIKVNVGKSGIDKYMFVKSETIPSKYIPYGSYCEFKSEKLKSAINKIVEDGVGGKLTNELVISCWGDSKTEGNQDGTGVTYPSHLQTLINNAGINATVNNFGIGGEYSSEVAQRQGGLRLTVQPFTIPADTSKVNISLNGRLRIASKHTFNPCYIAGVKGTIIHDWSDNTQKTFTFQRLEAGDAVEVKYPVGVLSNYMINNRNDDVLVIDIGCNGGYSSIENWIQQIRCMVDYSHCKEFIVIGLANHLAYTFGSTSENYTTLEDKFEKEFGNRYINLRKFYVEYGLATAGLTETSQDTTDIANGIPPASLYKSGDDYHENQHGYKIKAKLVFEKLKELGVLNK